MIFHDWSKCVFDETSLIKCHQNRIYQNTSCSHDWKSEKEFECTNVYKKLFFQDFLMCILNTIIKSILKFDVITLLFIVLIGTST